MYSNLLFSYRVNEFDAKTSARCNRLFVVTEHDSRLNEIASVGTWVRSQKFLIYDILHLALTSTCLSSPNICFEGQGHLKVKVLLVTPSTEMKFEPSVPSSQYKKCAIHNWSLNRLTVGWALLSVSVPSKSEIVY